jgi:hypothetical protein
VLSRSPIKRLDETNGSHRYRHFRLPHFARFDQLAQDTCSMMLEVSRTIPALVSEEANTLLDQLRFGPVVTHSNSDCGQ